jgi:hypothetical protein
MPALSRSCNRRRRPHHATGPPTPAAREGAAEGRPGSQKHLAPMAVFAGPASSWIAGARTPGPPGDGAILVSRSRGIRVVSPPRPPAGLRSGRSIVRANGRRAGTRPCRHDPLSRARRATRDRRAGGHRRRRAVRRAPDLALRRRRHRQSPAGPQSAGQPSVRSHDFRAAQRRRAGHRLDRAHLDCALSWRQHAGAGPGAREHVRPRAGAGHVDPARRRQPELAEPGRLARHLAGRPADTPARADSPRRCFGPAGSSPPTAA